MDPHSPARFGKMTLSPIPPEIRQMPVPQRIQLVEQIWNSIAEDESAFELTDAQKTELDRRLAAHRTAPDRGEPWENVKARLLGN